MIDPYPSRLSGSDGDAPRPIPRAEPVVASIWTEDAPLRQAESAAFDRDGYLLLPDLFGAAEVDALQQAAGRLMADPKRLEPETLVTEPGSGEVRSIFAVHRQSDAIGRLACDSRLVAIARYLLADDVYVHQSRLNMKPGFEGREFFWHSDFETWHSEDGMPQMRAVSMSVLLSENSPHNGPVMVMPGSHRHFLPCVGPTPEAHYRQSLRRQEIGVPDPERLAEMAEAHGIVAPLGTPGSVLIFDCNLLHGSNGNITPFPRSNAFIVYNAMSNRLVAPFGGTRPRPEFVATRNPRALVPAQEPLENAA